MLCGIPTSGKSTFIKKLIKSKAWENSIVLSTDNYIEKEAKRLNISYDLIFQQSIAVANHDLNLYRNYAIQNSLNIIHDQTNLTIKTRRQKLSKIPDFYSKIGLYFTITLEDALERNKNREGKYIPEIVMEQMFHKFQIPTFNENFNFISQYKLNDRDT